MTPADRAQLQRVVFNAHALLFYAGVPMAELRMAQAMGRAAEKLLGFDRCGRQAPPMGDDSHPPQVA